MRFWCCTCDISPLDLDEKHMALHKKQLPKLEEPKDLRAYDDPEPSPAWRAA